MMMVPMESIDFGVSGLTPFPVPHDARRSLPTTHTAPTHASHHEYSHRSSCAPMIEVELCRSPLLTEVCNEWIELTGFRASDWPAVEALLEKLYFSVEKKAFTQTNRHYIKLNGGMTERKRLVQRDWLAVTNRCHRPLCYVKLAVPPQNDITRTLIEQANTTAIKSTPMEGGMTTKRSHIPVEQSRKEFILTLLFLLASLLRKLGSQTKFSNWKGYIWP
eukprot:Blabericola_migrator_1__12952@NODE_857_length_6241_cov_107_054746_g607_i0_p4_GENE_NODE_857_length_6241_cov_107_054746_g607_i0NODE_857_length_6241_cov_107_054746_g607_i0_p4_ORF_typecomplete_len219_score33_63_NODE_857_length_6241_cov_107_054746_g607_i0125781